MLSLLYFTMNSCQPCKTFKPTVISAASESGINIKFIDALENSDISSAYSITSVPTLIFLKNGSVVHRITGVVGKQELVSQIQKYNL